MKIKAHFGRCRRGRGRSLKLGRAALQKLTDEAFQAEIARVRSGQHPALRKQARRIRRTLKQLRNPNGVKRRLIIRRGFRDSEILDAIYPDRQNRWLPSWNRSKLSAVDLTNFSFLDNPRGTMEMLRQIAECEAECRAFSMNFDDRHCHDIAPYMVLGLIHQRMLPVCHGGRIRHGINRVIGAVHLTDYLGMDTAPVVNNSVLPFPLRERRGKGTSRRDNSAWAVTSEERVDSKLVETIDGWLGSLTPPFQLSQGGRENILTLVGEILDNAKRHSDVSEDGTWAIAGFMETRKRDDNTVARVCHIGIINPGLTIFQTLQTAPASRKAKIAKFAEAHKPTWPKTRKYDEEALWTLCSLQDGISRAEDEETPHGFGMLTLVEAMNALGKTSRTDEQPRMSIISGTACLVVRPPYNNPVRTAGGHRALALNSSNNLLYPPDEDYVFSLPYRFAGTIVSIRFCIDADGHAPTVTKDGTDA